MTPKKSTKTATAKTTAEPNRIIVERTITGRVKRVTATHKMPSLPIAEKTKLEVPPFRHVRTGAWFNPHPWDLMTLRLDEKATEAVWRVSGSKHLPRRGGLILLTQQGELRKGEFEIELFQTAARVATGEALIVYNGRRKMAMRPTWAEQDFLRRRADSFSWERVYLVPDMAGIKEGPTAIRPFNKALFGSIFLLERE